MEKLSLKNNASTMSYDFFVFWWWIYMILMNTQFISVSYGVLIILIMFDIINAFILLISWTKLEKSFIILISLLIGHMNEVRRAIFSLIRHGK
jgi:hypothetical protein